MAKVRVAADDRKHIRINNWIVAHKWCAHQQHWVKETLFNRSSKTKDGLRYYCKDCESILNHLRKDEARFNAIRRRYGITKHEYLDIIEEQHDRCPICEEKLPTDTKKVHVDHCHKTEKIRGILCARCNTTLGRFNDDIQILENAIEYLRGES